MGFRLKSSRGATIVEYGLVLGLLGVGTITTVLLLERDVESAFCQAADTLNEGTSSSGLIERSTVDCSTAGSGNSGGGASGGGSEGSGGSGGSGGGETGGGGAGEGEGGSGNTGGSGGETGGGGGTVAEDLGHVTVARFSHGENGLNFWADWTGGEGFQDCVLQANDGSGWVNLQSLDCTQNDQQLSLFGFPYGAGGWSDIDVRLAANDGMTLIAELGTLTCRPQPPATAFTPTLDEDCDGVFDNQTYVEEVFDPAMDNGYWVDYLSNFCTDAGFDEMVSRTSRMVSGSGMRFRPYYGSSNSTWTSTATAVYATAVCRKNNLYG